VTKKNEVVAQEVVIKNVVVKIGEREIVLTIEEAKKLKDALEGIFGKEVIKETKIIHEHDWYEKPYVWPWPQYPKITWKDEPMWHDKPYYEVTCDAKMFNGDVPKGFVKNTMFLSIKG
jgi:monoamine oxidase